MEAEAEIEVLDMNVELQVYDKVTAAVDAAMVRCGNIILCYDTPKDIKESKSWIYQHLRTLNAPIDQAHKVGKAEALRFTRAMDEKRNSLKEKVKKQIDEKYAPIKKIEDAEIVKKAEAELKAREQFEAEEAAQVAELEAREQAVADERAAIEKEKAEIDQKAREARAALDAKKEAEHQAKLALEASENKRIAEVQAVKDKAAAEAAALSRHLAELEAKEKDLAEEAERKEQERQANVEHRKKIHTEIYETLKKEFFQIGQWEKGRLDEHLAKGVFTVLKSGKIPHVTIQY